MRNRMKSGFVVGIISLGIGSGVALWATEAFAADCKKDPYQKGCPCYCDPKAKTCPACNHQDPSVSTEEHTATNATLDRWSMLTG